MANASLGATPAPTSRSTTPKPKLPSLRTGGGVAAGIGANDPDLFDHADPPALPHLRPSGPPLSLPVARRSSQSEHLPDGSRPSLRPPPIGGGSRKRGLLLAIPVGSAPMGAIGQDEPDALNLIGHVEDVVNGSTQSNGAQPMTPLNLGGDEGDVTVRPALPQGHTQAKSIDQIKAVISPAPSTSSPAEVNDEDWAEADEFLKDVQRLGEGAGGEVWKVTDTRTGKELARKLIQARTTPPKQLVRELRYLKDTTHPNIVRFYGAYISPSSSEVKVLMEFCEGGSLEAIGEKIKNGRGRIHEHVAAKIGEGVRLLPFPAKVSPSSSILVGSMIQSYRFQSISRLLLDSISGAELIHSHEIFNWILFTDRMIP